MVASTTIQILKGSIEPISLMDLMNFDAEDRAELITQPVLMITGDISDTRYMTDAIFEKATCTKDKKLHYIKGANRVETYWKEKFVGEEVNEVWEFFEEKLQYQFRPANMCSKD